MIKGQWLKYKTVECYKLCGPDTEAIKKNGKEKSKLMMQIPDCCILYKNDLVFLLEQVTKALVLTVLFLMIEPGEGTFW